MDLPTDLALLWGKTGPNGSYHPLICHMLDVAAVALCMWSEVLAPSVRCRLSQDLGLPEAEAGRWVAFFAGLHDLGKASPGFALQNKDAAGRLRAYGFKPSPLPAKCPHGTVTANTLRHALRDFSLNEGLVGSLARVLGGHHGAFPRSEDLRLPTLTCGIQPWTDARAALTRSLADTLAIDPVGPTGELLPETAMYLAGFVSVADWIGSAERFFPHAVTGSAEPHLAVSRYADSALRQASRGLKELGWLAGAPPREPLTFRQLFPSFSESPRQVQVSAEALAFQLRPPCLVLIEAPMGEGKTEAAMYLADRWGSQGYPGCYFALPTMATSNQMFARVREFLATRYTGEALNLQLLHGHAGLSAEFRVLREAADSLLLPSGVHAARGYDGASAGVVAAEWFTHRKRGLLAPFGVGTIDQALLAVLQTRHAFVRLFGLAGKTVIVDEVHAYETYTTTLLQRLLEWLAALGSPVVLLSATLPADRRLSLLRAYARGLGQPALELSSLCEPYPRLTWVNASGVGELYAEPSPLARREVRVNWVNGDIACEGRSFPLGERLTEVLESGGCVAVICNTVGKAQQVYRALKPYFPGEVYGEPELDLFHARFLFGERDAREKRALLRFGKPGTKVEVAPGEAPEVRRPRRAVLVATQVIEQSLDLDFDLLVSEMAPIDLLLQRVGRLWRHDRGGRRHGLHRPELWLVRPEIDERGTPSFGRGNEYVYAPHLLLRSWLTLRDRPSISLPDDIEVLVGAVYNEADCQFPQGEPLAALWRETKQKLEAMMQGEESSGLSASILPPDFALEDVLEDFNRCLEEDDPRIHVSLQARTRLGPPSLRAVVLDHNEAALAEVLEPGDPNQVEKLLRRSVEISHPALVPRLLAELPPPAWSRVSLLRHLRLVQLEADGSRKIGEFVLRVDPELGLTIDKPNKEEG
ncbi:MAG: CRISPR-associated helicase Cas3' [Chloroflexota bacterium]